MGTPGNEYPRETILNWPPSKGNALMSIQAEVKAHNIAADAGQGLLQRAGPHVPYINHAALTNEHGRLRVGNTRVLLDLVICSFRLGHTPETITAQYPSLSLDDLTACHF
jgi:hypothetical protein